MATMCEKFDYLVGMIFESQHKNENKEIVRQRVRIVQRKCQAII